MRRTLPEWLSYSEHLHPVGIDMGLQRIGRVAARLGVVPPARRNFVIAGTNGKGSVSVYLEALLMARGYRVGTTLSPHLSRFNERIRVNGQAASDADICEAYCAIEAARADVTLTYFEFGILAALLIFQRSQVDVTVLEVGLGGRLDAVNLVDASVCVITSIGIDHVAYLGDNRESIGKEKAGILRPHVPCVYGETSMPRSVADAATRLSVPLLRYGAQFNATAQGDGWQFDGVRGDEVCVVQKLRMPSVALNNAATALQALLVLDATAPVDVLVAAAADARLPGRFEHWQYRGLAVIVDVAHNPHGAQFLARQLAAQQFVGSTVAVAGFLQDKDAAGIVAALDLAIDEWIFVDTTGLRGQTGEQSARTAGAVRTASVGVSLRDALDGLVSAGRTPVRVVVLGSFDVAQRARELLGCANAPSEVQRGR